MLNSQQRYVRNEKKRSNPFIKILKNLLFFGIVMFIFLSAFYWYLDQNSDDQHPSNEAAVFTYFAERDEHVRMFTILQSAIDKHNVLVSVDRDALASLDLSAEIAQAEQIIAQVNAIAFPEEVATYHRLYRMKLATIEEMIHVLIDLATDDDSAYAAYKALHEKRESLQAQANAEMITVMDDMNMVYTLNSDGEVISFRLNP